MNDKVQNSIYLWVKCFSISQGIIKEIFLIVQFADNYNDNHYDDDNNIIVCTDESQPGRVKQANEANSDLFCLKKLLNAVNYAAMNVSTADA